MERVVDGRIEMDTKRQREIIDAATEGKWYTERDSNGRLVIRCHYGREDVLLTMNMVRGEYVDNATFIAAAREEWPAALAELERLKGEYQELLTVIAVVRDECGEQEDRADKAETERDDAIERGVKAIRTLTMKLQEADDAAAMFQVYKLVAEGLQETAERRAEQAEARYDTEMAYSADLEAGLACDYCASPLDHLGHLAEDKRQAEADNEALRGLLMPSIPVSAFDSTPQKYYCRLCCSRWLPSAVPQHREDCPLAERGPR